MGSCCVRDEDYQSAKSMESLRILVDKDIIYFTSQQKAIMSETDDKDKQSKLETIQLMINYYNDVKVSISKDNFKDSEYRDFSDFKTTLTEMHQNANIFRFAKFEENYKKLKNLLKEKDNKDSGLI